MSLSIDGVWKAGVWAETVWADDVWREGEADTRQGDGKPTEYEKTQIDRLIALQHARVKRYQRTRWAIILSHD